MARHARSPRSLAAAALLLAGVASTACDSTGDVRAAASHPVDERTPVQVIVLKGRSQSRDSDAAPDRKAAHVVQGAGDAQASAEAEPKRPPAHGEDAPGATDPSPAAGPTDDGRTTPAAQLGEAMATLVRDLEFTKGLQEPPQQTVVPPPAPWTPAPDADTSPSPVIDAVSPAGGTSRGGTVVTIRGRNLQVAQVVFGLAPARILAASDEAVTVAAPAENPGPVTVVVTNRDGNYAIAASTFRYEP